MSQLEAKAIFDCLIIGAGASGLFCANELANNGLKILVLESDQVSGRKLCLAGGGKANFSNRQISPKDYLCSKPTFCSPTLKNFSPDSLLQRLKQWHLPYEERKHGQLFLQTAAKNLHNIFLESCQKANCQILCQQAVLRVDKEGETFQVKTANDSFVTSRLVLATGSPARPQIGSSASGLAIAKSLGHKIIPFRPALTPFILSQFNQRPCANLAGISLTVKITLPSQNRTWQDALLFTHDGISGPAVLKTSLFWQDGEKISINFAPEVDFENLLDNAPKLLVRNIAKTILPNRLSEILIPNELADRKSANLARKERQYLAKIIHNYELVPDALASLERAEVCSGGVDVDSIRPNSLESSLVKNLWFIGEVMDVTGLLGGYNLHFAFASAFSASRSILKSYKKEHSKK